METQPFYNVVTKGYDWGPGNWKIIIFLGEKISEAKESLFEVKATKNYTRYDTSSKTTKNVIGTSDIKVISSYLSDEEGMSVEGSSSYIALELEVGPDMLFSNPFNYDFSTGLNKNVGISYTITQQEDIFTVLGRKIDPIILTSENQKEVIVPETRPYKMGKFDYCDSLYGDIHLTYAAFQPKLNRKRPLIVILHGAGEGGTDPEVALLGNKVVALSSPLIQDYFSGADILVPQTSTMWMDNGTGQYTRDGKSCYIKALLALIESYIADQKDIDQTRIYVGGGSNGGYMTLALLLEKPELFAGAFAICEAYESTWISDHQLETIKDVPLWFVHSKDDTTIPFDKTAKPIFERLQRMGAKDVRLSAFEKVEDKTGLYFNSEGQPYCYNGHWSWIYVYNDKVWMENRSLFEWLAALKKESVES